MGKAEKKIQIVIDNLNKHLDKIFNYRVDIKNESNDKKINKINKKIESEKRMVLLYIKDLNKLDINIQNTIQSLKPEYQVLMKEILPNGNDNISVKNQGKRNNIINHHKDRLNKLKEAYQKYPMYDASLPVEEKLKNKLYKYEKEVGFFIYTESNKERSIYEPVWNYLEHIDETHEFTEEEKRILQHCYKIGEEYDKYRYNRIDTKLNAIGNFVGDIGYKRFAQGLSNKLFPKYIWMIYPNQNFNDIELKQLGKIMTAKYITFAADKEELKNILRRRLEIINEIRGTNKENEIIDIYAKTTEDEDTQLFAILKEEFSAEDALFVHLYTDDPDISRILEELSRYSLEELGLDVNIQA